MNVNIALLTVTDTRTFDNDKSGAILVKKIEEANHNLIDRKICKDNKEDIVLILREWISKKDIVFDEFLNYWPLVLTVFIGGQAGNYLNIKFLSNKTLAIITSISFLLIHSFNIKTMSSLLSLHIFLSIKL